jgi:hypothetical protein
MEAIQALFSPYGRHFQVGQAVNRSKWGIWRFSEYLELYAVAAEILRRDPGAELLGPAVIDFELHATAALVNMAPESTHFDIVSSLLYVDRRGAPENRQLGFDTVDKVVLLKAIADVARRASPRSWITEVNWPLWEGPHSPAGKTVAVDEEQQADFLVRYYLLALCTGLVERVYWWQLVAKGYGLIDPSAAGAWRRRPALLALANLRLLLEGSRFVGPLDVGESCRLYLFASAEGEEIAVGWSLEGRERIRLPRPARRVVERDGESAAMPPTTEVDVSSSPRYFHLVTT